MLPRRFLLFGLNKIYNINPEVICTSMPYRLAARFVGCCGSEDGIYCGGISRKFVLFTLTPQRRSHTVYVHSTRVVAVVEARNVALTTSIGIHHPTIGNC